ncbi:MAG TPA: hypothetical protein VK668_09015 [Mucilaginibacter sp.]|nr:hypothetical protein [Mucilaginibacter sp.]
MNNNSINLSEDQISMLQLSDMDIKTGKLISQEELDEMTLNG